MVNMLIPASHPHFKRLGRKCWVVTNDLRGPTCASTAAVTEMGDESGSTARASRAARFRAKVSLPPCQVRPSARCKGDHLTTAVLGCEVWILIGSEGPECVMHPAEACMPQTSGCGRNLGLQDSRNDHQTETGNRGMSRLHDKINHSASTAAFRWWDPKGGDTASVKQETAMLGDLGRRVDLRRVAQKTDFDRTGEKSGQGGGRFLASGAVQSKIIDEAPREDSWEAVVRNENATVSQTAVARVFSGVASPRVLNGNTREEIGMAFAKPPEKTGSEFAGNTRGRASAHWKSHMPVMAPSNRVDETHALAFRNDSGKLVEKF